jgi:DNA invertase Pin-like site-specific DNA recombinase
LYARVSTSNSGQSPEMQLHELREYCERRGWLSSERRAVLRLGYDDM